jgi:hypothetical protein
MTFERTSAELRAACCAAILVAALLTFLHVFLLRAQGDPPAKPDTKRNVEAANKLAQRYDGEVHSPVPGSGGGIRTIFLSRRGARENEVVTNAIFPSNAKLKIGDRGLAELCDLLRRLPGPKGLVLEETAVSDRGLAAVGQLTDLHRLELCGTPIGDDGLKQIGGLKELQDLNLSGTKVRDAALKHLKPLTRLKELSLAGLPISDDGLAALADLPGLEYLDLSDTPIGKKGLAHLKDLKELRGLRLANTRIQDGALKALAGLKKLQDFDLQATALTGADLAPLKGLSHLRHLQLDRTKVGDAGLAHLAGLRNMESLFLERTRVTEVGLKHLTEMPRLNVLPLSGLPAVQARDRITFAKGDASDALRWSGKIRLVTDGSTKVFVLARLHDTEKARTVGSKLYHDRLVQWGREQITCWAFSPDGKLVATGSGYREKSGPDKTSVGQVRIWEVPDGGLVATYPAALGYVTAVAFSKDGKKVLVQAESYVIDGR